MIVIAISTAAFIIILTLGVLYGKERAHSSKPAPATLTATSTSPPTKTIAVSPSPATDVPPLPDSKLSAASIVLGEVFAPPDPSGPPTRIVYNAAGQRICIREKRGLAYRNNVGCLEGLNPLVNTPLAYLDWLGGPSIYFVTDQYLLSGVDYIPQNDSWRLSSVAGYKIKVHNQTQLAPLPWLNGTGTWVYYQDPDEQIREFGRDDYRDTVWRDGSAGALGAAQPGSGIAVARWVNGSGGEVGECFFQARNSAIIGRVYVKSAWTAGYYAIDGTPEKVPNGASLTTTTIPDPQNPNSNWTILLGYISKSGFLTVQTRVANNDTQLGELGAFSGKVDVVEGDGRSKAGIAANGWRVWIVTGQQVVEGSSSSNGRNWTTSTVGS